MDKKKILIIHPTIAPYRIDFFNDLCEAFDVRILLQFWNLKDQTFDYDKIYSQFKFVPEYLPEGSPLKACRAIKRVVREFRPDIILTSEYGLFTLYSFFLTRLGAARGAGLVVMTDDSFDMVSGRNEFTAIHRFARAMMSRIIDGVVVCDPKVLPYYRTRRCRAFCFPIIVDERKAVPRYERILPLSRELAEKYDIYGRRVLLFVGRLVQVKNLRRVIEAFGQSDTDAVLVIVGDGKEGDALRECASRISKKVIFTGRLEGDELYAFYNIAQVFILASTVEPFGAVTNEALLAGCRVVVSGRAGSAALVDESNGETVDPYDSARIAEAIDRQFALSRTPDLSGTRGSGMTIRYETLIEDFKEFLQKL